ncbi:MAG: cbb3-type cytochrome c oxidase subunit I [bacterium]
MAKDTARTYWRIVLVWLLAGCALGLLCALSLIFPDLARISPVLGYGRLLAAHRAAMIHGVLFTFIFALSYSILPPLVQLSPSRWVLGKILLAFGSLVVLFGLIFILAGKGSGWEYSDFPVELSFLFWLYLLGTAIDIGYIVINGRVLREHPATGFLILAALLPSVAYPFTIPGWWGAGLFAPLRIWIGWRTIFFGSFTAAAIGSGIWILGAQKPSPKLNRGAFIIAALLFTGLAPFSGIVHLLDAPLISGLKAWGAFSAIVAGTGLIILAILLIKKIDSNPSNVLLLGGAAGLIIASVQGMILCVPPIYTAFHYTMNTSGHAHLAFGSIMLIFIAGGILSASYLSGRKFPSGGKMLLYAGLFATGMLLIVLFQSAIGFLQSEVSDKSQEIASIFGAIRRNEYGILLGGVLAFFGVVLMTPLFIRALKPDENSRIAQELHEESERESSDGGEERS